MPPPNHIERITLKSKLKRILITMLSTMWAIVYFYRNKRILLPESGVRRSCIQPITHLPELIAIYNDSLSSFAVTFSCTQHAHRNDAHTVWAGVRVPLGSHDGEECRLPGTLCVNFGSERQ